MRRLVNGPVKHLKHLGNVRNEKRIITRFADQFGLVYFGFVSQHDDEHRIVRGMTLSTNHRDEHYCIGTYENYDVIFVERSDVLQTETKKKKSHRWHVIAFDLKTTRELPHIFVGLHTHSEEFYMLFFTKFPGMRQLTLGHTAAYPPQFAANHRLYANPAAIIDVESVMTPEAATIIATHFQGVAFEVVDKSLYIYSESPRLSSDLLETLLKNGRWLAESIDKSATISYDEA